MYFKNVEFNLIYIHTEQQEVKNQTKIYNNLNKFFVAQNTTVYKNTWLKVDMYCCYSAIQSLKYCFLQTNKNMKR